MPVVHFGIGFAGALAVLALVRAERNYSLAVVSGFWALVPRLYFLLPTDAPVRPAAHELLFVTPVGDLFWFNRFVVRHAGTIQPTDGSHVLGAAGFALLLATCASVDGARANLDSLADEVSFVRRAVRSAWRPGAHRRGPK